MSDFFRFPHTPHLAWLGSGLPRDDKVLAPVEAKALLQEPVVVEEKLDGANLGFSIDDSGALRQQNRGQYLDSPFTGQFLRLGPWLEAHEDSLFDGLEPHLIAFGEWCAARHSLDYSSLPDWWLLFDIFDRREGNFWSTARRDEWAERLGFKVVPRLSHSKETLRSLTTLLESASSHFRAGPMEGVVVRVEDQRWLRSRAKLVRSDFSQAITKHWRQRTIDWNRLRSAP